MLYSVAKSDINYTFLGGIGIMESKQQDESDGVMPSEKKTFRERLMKILEHPYFSAVAASITVSLLTGAINYLCSIKPLTDKVDSIEANINTVVEASVANQLTVVEERLSNDINTKISTIQNQLIDLKNEANTTNNITNNITINPGSELGKLVKDIYYSDQTVYMAAENPEPLDLKQVVATDKVTGSEYTASDLENKTIIMTYYENDEEVFFKGQFDENGYWNDDCVINKYKNGKLTMVMDAIYESGKLRSYKQIFPYTTLNGDDVWVVSIRKVEENEGEDVRSGETFMYFRTEEYVKAFDDEYFSDADVINTDDFGEKVDLKIEGYYNGYTSNGKYNDDSKTAYLVKYNYEGKVRYLYVGKIKDGLPNDNSRDAWSISWGYADDGYYYYQGEFYNGKHETPPNWKPMTQEEINNIVNSDDFNCPLTGLLDARDL